MKVSRLPNEGFQPQVAAEERGVLHMVYYSGDARAGELSYVRSTDRARFFGLPPSP